jgi:hypothetical protein
MFKKLFQKLFGKKRRRSLARKAPRDQFGRFLYESDQKRLGRLNGGCCGGDGCKCSSRD